MYQFNANLLINYTEVLLGMQSRLEDTKPDRNKNLTNGSFISNQSLLIGFVFKYLLDCETDEEAYELYKKDKERLDKDYRIDRLIKKLSFQEIEALFGVNITPKKKLRLALYFFYQDHLDENEVKNILGLSKSETKKRRI